MPSLKKNLAHSARIINHLRIVRSSEHAEGLLARLSERHERATIVSWLNANALTIAHRDDGLRGNLLKSSILLRDGVGISILLRLLGMEAGTNMNGTDFIPRIIRSYAGKSVALLGTQEPYLSRAAAAVEKMGARVVLRMDGFEPPAFYAERLAGVEADLVILAMGMPKQEQVASYLAEKLERPCLILNGGAILDFLAERFPRAPYVWRRLRMEWLFRMIQEPRRLGRRYVVGGAVFIAHTFQMVFMLRNRLKNA
ncbi:MAG: WecB/TagA/CpsF family glycosyltransferase [Alphaproteobacteria bacterium]|nr:WecB/TagA/CpsF family glycosyltransferase [Alphaproteobacteria bacterium]